MDECRYEAGTVFWARSIRGHEAQIATSPTPAETKALPIKFLAVMDDFTKELLSLEANQSSGSQGVIRILENIFPWRGKPAATRSDNGSAFTSARFMAWMNGQGFEHFLMQPGKPR
jgi:transposase InsO family protein